MVQSVKWHTVKARLKFINWELKEKIHSWFILSKAVSSDLTNIEIESSNYFFLISMFWKRSEISLKRRR